VRTSEEGKVRFRKRKKRWHAFSALKEGSAVRSGYKPGRKKGGRKTRLGRKKKIKGEKVLIMPQRKKKCGKGTRKRPERKGGKKKGTWVLRKVNEKGCVVFKEKKKGEEPKGKEKTKNKIKGQFFWSEP